MSQEIKNKLVDLLSPQADLNNMRRLKKELEWVDTANWTQSDWQLYYQVFN